MRSTEICASRASTTTRRRRAFIARGRRAATRCASSRTGPNTGQRERVRAQARGRAALAPPARRRSRAVPRGPARRRLGVLERAARRRRATSAAISVLRCIEPGDSQRDRRPAARSARPHRLHSARLLRLDRRQSDHVPAEVPGVRRRRHGAGLPRGAAPGRTRSRSGGRAFTSAEARGVPDERRSAQALPADRAVPPARR